MFHYSQYRSTDDQLIRRFVDQFPLAIITSCVGGDWLSSHIPLFWASPNSNGELLGHADAANAQFSNVVDLPVHLIFSGPNMYIPPEAYATRQLPTWNYLAVHARATLNVETDPARNLEILSETARHLRSTPSKFRVERDDQRVQRWIGSIRGVRIRVHEIEGRFKLSQDKAPDDVISAANYFSEKISQSISPETLLEFSGLEQVFK
ncbi:FMN-binding negative transcriptional regulator [Noviherbaspirillum sp. ST9]|uniref:FMN-binding negative transcriptional regulator n=1 Tax=Noviherbaspirillum sp. ST9 TaxID=3401606 RepID=UPI003B5892D5